MQEEKKQTPSRKPVIILIVLVGILFIGIYVTIFAFAGNTQFDASHKHNATSTTSSSSANNNIFLMCGKDTVSGLTDVILLVKFNVNQGEVSILQIPRDTFVSLDHSNSKKINSVSGGESGIENLKNLLESSWKISIDYTVEFTLEAFSHFIDLIGGITVNVPYDMDYEDPSQNLQIHIKAGNNLLYGDAAAQFVRFRSGYVQGDLARIDAQKIFMAALAKKATTELSPFKMPAVAGALIGEINTNMSLQECLTFARAALNIDMKNITMTTLPGKDARAQNSKGAWYYIINRTATHDVINRHFRSTENPVLLSEFDREYFFCSHAYPHFEKIYNDQGYSIKEHRADDIINNGIDIDIIP